MKKSLFRRLLVSALALCLAAALAVPVCAATLYADGDFRYTVVDDGIILQHFYGTDAEVTVPASIAGHPVSEIAAGTFADNAAVKTINLPDTIMQIDEGAFAAGQTVNYNTNVAAPAATVTPQPGTTAAPTATPQPGTTAAPTATPQPATQAPGATAAPAGEYSVEEATVGLPPVTSTTTLAVNEKGNLVQVDAAGNTTVLDDTQTYTTQQTADGSTEILNAAGDPVTVAPTATPQPAGAATPAATTTGAAPAVFFLLGVLALAGGGFWLYKRCR